jgi:hypothetical protein
LSLGQHHTIELEKKRKKTEIPIPILILDSRFLIPHSPSPLPQKENNIINIYELLLLLLLLMD